MAVLPTAALSIGSPGPDDIGTTWSTLGLRRSKAAAALTHVRADAMHWADRFRSDADDPAVSLHETLIDPGIAEAQEALESVGKFLGRKWTDSGQWGGEFKFAFSGHGQSDGSLVLRDGELRASEILEAAAHALPRASKAHLKAGMALDCCYAGAALSIALLTRPPLVSLRDGLASSLHDEESFEYPELGHGLFTYVLRHQTPLEDSGKSVRDLLISQGWTIENDTLVPPKQPPAHPPLTPPGLELSQQLAATPIRLDAIPYFSDGDQHALDIMNSHLVAVRGKGEIDLADPEYEGIGLVELADLLEEIRTRPLDLGISFPGSDA